MTRRYPVLYEWSGKNFGGFSPDIPGCAATAKTLPKIREALRGALESHLRWMEKDGDPIPLPSSSTTVDMTDDPEFPNPPGYYVVVEWLEVAMPRKRKVMQGNKQRELTAA